MSKLEIFSAWPISSQLWKENKDIYWNFFENCLSCDRERNCSDCSWVLWLSKNTNSIVLNLLSWWNLKKSFDFENIAKKRWDCEYIWHSSEILKIFMDKFETKKFLEEKWFDVTKWFLIDFSENFHDKILNNLKFPILIKEVDNLWGAWIYVLKNSEDLENFSFNKEKKYLTEEFVEWNEYSWNIFSHSLNKDDILWKKTVEIFPPVEKWETWITEDNLPRHSLNKIRKTFFDKNIENRIRDISLEIWKIDGINWFLEIEFIYDKSDDKLKIIEVNPRPSWTLEIALKSCNFKIKNFLDNLWNIPDFTNNLLQQKYCVEVPVVHKNSDFEPAWLNLPENAEVFWKKELRKFPPYSEIYSLSFDKKLDAENFLEKIEKK